MFLSKKQLWGIENVRKDKPVHFSASVSLVLLLGSKSFNIKDEKKTSSSVLRLSKNKAPYSLVSFVRTIETFHISIS